MRPRVSESGVLPGKRTRTSATPISWRVAMCSAESSCPADRKTLPSVPARFLARTMPGSRCSVQSLYTCLLRLRRASALLLIHDSAGLHDGGEGPGDLVDALGMPQHQVALG